MGSWAFTPQQLIPRPPGAEWDAPRSGRQESWGLVSGGTPDAVRMTGLPLVFVTICSVHWGLGSGARAVSPAKGHRNRRSVCRPGGGNRTGSLCLGRRTIIRDIKNGRLVVNHPLQRYSDMWSKEQQGIFCFYCTNQDKNARAYLPQDLSLSRIQITRPKPQVSNTSSNMDKALFFSSVAVTAMGSNVPRTSISR